MANKQSKKTSVADHWQGHLEGLHGKLLYGWVLNLAKPQARVVLEICLNGEAFGCVIADMARPELPELQKNSASSDALDVCHGFVADVGMADGKGILTVRVANTDFVLPGEVHQNAPGLAPRIAVNHVFGDGGLRLLGWALDPLDPARNVSVSAYLGSQRVAQAQANRDHPALRAFENGRYGFTLDLPLELADGETRSIRVVDDQGLPLHGSPYLLCCYPDSADVLLQGTNTSLLLQNVLRQVQHYLPRSLGYAHYSAWAQRFNGADTPSAGERLDSAALTVALIIVGAAPDSDAFRISLENAQQQTGVRCEIYPKPSTRRRSSSSSSSSAPQALALPFAQTLKAALDGGADFIACIRAGDTLTPLALHRLLHAAHSCKAALVYGDSETLVTTTTPNQWQPWFKPAWNPEYALGTDYPLELLLMQSSLLQTCLAQQSTPANAPALAWMALAQVWSSGAVLHLPHVVYRSHSPFTAEEKRERHAAASAVLARLEPESRLLPMENTTEVARRLQRSLSPQAQSTRVSLIIPTRDQQPLLQACIDSLLQWTDWPNLEIIVVDNDSALPETHAYFRSLKSQGIRVLPVSGVFNFSRINNVAVAAAQGEVIGLINNDVQALHAGWLQEMLSHLFQPGVGAVGAKLLWPNQMVQHGGIVLGMGNVAGHFGNLLLDGDWGDHGRNQLPLQVSGVTAACLFMRKADYLDLGGLDEVAFPVAFNDVDLCLRLRARGMSIIWTPYAKLLHAESASRGKEDTPQKQARAQRELAQLRTRWGRVLLQDPAYHPCLNLDAHSHPFSGLALPPRKRNPRWAGLVFEEEE